ncbi:MAG: Uma2 family endonuclease [Spirochaetota bacterium]
MSVDTRHTTKLTYDDYVHFPDDGNRHEIIDGAHYMSPSPTAAHQDASRHIQFQLYQAIEERGLGRVYDAPMDLQLSDTDVVQPDLMIVLSEHADRVSPSRLLGPPDLVVEILSPATAERDRSLKLKLYEQYRVPEYWIVDLDNHTVTRYRVAGGAAPAGSATSAEGAPPARSAAGGYELVERVRDEITYRAEPAGERGKRIEAHIDLQKVWRRISSHQ